VPHLGTVVLIQSDKVAADKLSFTHLAELDVKYGLFPPLSLEVDAVSDTSVDLSWDPGLITEHIDSYRIYWDTESGGQCSTGLEDCTADYPGAGVNCPAGETCCSTPGDVCDSYDFDSVSDAAQVVFHTATSATVGGLDPATTYYFTVRSVSNYTDPASLVTTSYESAQYPTRIPAVPYDLPVEVAAVTTGGISTAGAVPDGHVRPGTPLTLSRGAGESIDLAWGVSCLPGDGNYGVYEGTLGNFSSHTPVTCDTAGATSFSFPPGDGNRYYLIVPTNSSFEGSYGLDGSGAERPVSAAPCLPQNLGDPVCP
jgi:hypothetical protein